jgi:hypothetical protein
MLISTATVTANDPGLIVSQTWNNGAVVFDGAIINITNAASAAGSSFLDFQLAGTSLLRFTTSVGAGAAPTIRSDGGNLVLNAGTGSQLYLNNDSGGNIVFAANALINDTFNVILGTATGSQIATAANQKLGFWGATPTTQATGYGTPTANTQTTNFPGTAATLAQVGGQMSQLLLDLKKAGIIGA